MSADFRRLFDLNGKVALVTGASQGIGAAIAQGFAAFGAKVVVSSRKQASIDAVAQSIKDSGGEAVAIAAHTGETAQLQQLVERVKAAFGGVDILVNNAAANPVYGPILQTDTAVFDKIMAVNVRGPLELAKLLHPLMSARGGGAVINISSIGGLTPEPGLGIYSVSKAALISLTKVLAQEWGKDGIRCNAICPGLVKTKFSAALWKDEKNLQRFLREVPLGRIAQPEEMVGLALFLASPAGSYCTGAVFTVDGGYVG